MQSEQNRGSTCFCTGSLSCADIHCLSAHTQGSQGMVGGVRQSSSYKKLQSKLEAANDWMNNSQVIGRESEMKFLFENVTPAERYGPYKVISVWGMTGVGKSALVRNLYSDRTSEKFSKYIWVDVSHPFNLNDFCRSILLGIHSEKDPVEECRKLLNNHRCLIVIDDLQTTREWDMIRTALLSEHTVSVIIVITSDARVATHCASKIELVFHLKSLEIDAAFDLFKVEVCTLTRILHFLRHFHILTNLISLCCLLYMVNVKHVQTMCLVMCMYFLYYSFQLVVPFYTINSRSIL